MNEKQSINIKFFQRGKVKYESTTLLTLYVRLQGILFAQVLYFGLLSKVDARYKLTCLSYRRHSCFEAGISG